jgi:hypothetical protein
MGIPYHPNYYSFATRKLWQDVSDGQQEAQTEKVQRGQSSEGNGACTDRRASRIASRRGREKQEGGEAQADPGKVAARKLKWIHHQQRRQESFMEQVEELFLEFPALRPACR